MKKLIFLVALLISSLAFSQKGDKFSSEKTAFIQDIGKFVKDTKKDQAKEILKNFEAFWGSGKLTTEQEKSFMAISNKLAKKRYYAYPHLTSLMQATRFAVDSQSVDQTTLDTLLFTFDKIIDNQKRPQYEQFCRAVVPFLRDGSLNNNKAEHIKTKGKFLIVWREEPIPDFSDEEETEEEEYSEDEYSDDYSEDNYEDEEYMSAEEAWEEDGDDYGSWDTWDESDEYSEENWDSDDAGWEEEGWSDEEYSDDYSEDDGYEEEPEEEEKVIRVGYIPPLLPEIKGAIIEFDSVDFEFYTRYDTAKIERTTATFLIQEKQVVAEGGTFDWTSAGLGPEVKGTFKQFMFASNRVAIEAEGFELQYPSKIDSTVEGIFKFLSTKHKKPEHAKYPRFMSYNADISLKDLCEGIKYTGGFSLEGQKIHSSCVSLAKSKIEVFGPRPTGNIPAPTSSNDSLSITDSTANDSIIETPEPSPAPEKVTSSGEMHKLFEARATYFNLDDSLITSHPTSVHVYFGEDSIYHPSVRMKYNCSTGQLNLYKNKSIYRNTPFVDSYHALDLDVDALKWNTKDTMMYFTTVSGKKHVTAYFMSKNYFSKKRFSHLKGLYPFHPLTMLSAYYKKYETRTIYLQDLADFSHQKEKTLDNSMKLLMRSGYIEYNGNKIKLTDKALFYVESNAMDVDYDVIIIPSVNPPKNNAELNLNNQGLTVYGVDSVYFSDSLDVNFHPTSRKVTIGKNRNFTFDGEVNTSIYNFNGRELTFDYESFSLDMIHIDSIKFNIDDTDTVTGRSKGTKQIDNKLSYSSGTLYIDSSINKSGKERFPQFPYFDANRGAYVYFNQPDVLGGVYDTTIHFKIPPFGSDSMSARSDAVNFDGAFHSGGIFPVFDEKLGVMEDYSFGFVHPTPDSGYSLYGGDGSFAGTIRLDKQGIRGKGIIKFLNTTIESEDIIFYKDSLVTIGLKSVTLPGPNELLDDSVQFPSVVVNDFELQWYPKKDSMHIKNLLDPFNFYDSTASLVGEITISHKGMHGDGIFEQKGSRTVSEEFYFEKNRFDGRNAEFEILSDVEGKPAVRSDYVKVHFELDSGYASFGPEQKGFASNEFPYLQYKSSIDQGVWDINNRTVTMTASDSADINNSYFYSTHPDQDSLVFNARQAVYSMDSLSLHVTGVPSITVADGRIIPDQEEVFIKENAQILPLTNAQIYMDTLNEYHHLVEANLEIESRSKFTGEAKYSYVNLESDSLFIKFNRFDLVEVPISKKKTELHTVCSGEVTIADSFLFGPKMYYAGSATMYANEKLLALDGKMRLEMNGSFPEPGWFAYHKRDSVDQLFLKTDSFISKSDKKRYTGIHYSTSRRDYYPTFMGKRGGKKDYSVFLSEGLITYDSTNTEFRVGDSLKIIGESYEGKLFAYNEDKETIRIEGILDLFGHPEPDENGDLPESPEDHVELLVSAEGDLHILDSLFEVNGLTFLTFDFETKALDEMGSNLEQMAAILGIPPAFHFNDTLAYEIADIAGEKAAQNFRENPTLPLPKVVKEFSKGLVFTNVHLEWSKKHRAWYSKRKFGVGSIGKHQVNALVDGYIEVKKKKGFSYTVKVYFKMADNTWYYFAYEKNKLLTISSNPTYNSIIADKSTKAKNEPIGMYYFDLASTAHPRKFEDKFIKTYWGDGTGEEIEFEDEFEEYIPTSDTLATDSSVVSDSLQLEDELIDDSTSMDELDDEDYLGGEEEEEDDVITEEDEDAMFGELEDEGLEDLEEESTQSDEIDDIGSDEELKDESSSEDGSYYIIEEEEEAPKEKKKKKDKKKKKE